MPVLNLINRAARAVRGDGNAVIAFHPGRRLQQGLRPAPAGGTAHRLDAEPLEHVGQQPAVAAGADHRRQAAVRPLGLDKIVVAGQGQGEAVVPDAVDDRAFGCRDSRRVLPATRARSRCKREEARRQRRPHNRRCQASWWGTTMPEDLLTAAAIMPLSSGWRAPVLPRRPPAPGAPGSREWFRGLRRLCSPRR